MRYLIVRLDGLGDTLLCTPMLRALREADAESHVTFMASPVGGLCMQGHPGIDELMIVSPSTPVAEKISTGRFLRWSKPPFDVAIALTEKIWAYVWLYMSRAPRRIGFWAGAEQPIKAGMILPALTDRIDKPGGLHEVERFMRLLEPLGMQAEPGPLWLPGAGQPAGNAGATSGHETRHDDVPANRDATRHGDAGPDGDASRADDSSPDADVAGAAPACSTKRAPLALHLSLKWLQQGWDASWLEELAVSLAAAPGGLLLTAGPPEADFARGFVERVRARAGSSLDALIDKGYAPWLERLRHCRCLVSMDTGAVHLAAALGVPVVDVFEQVGSETVVPQWRPWGVEHQIVLRGDSAAPGERDRVHHHIIQATSLLPSPR
jgi:ADP-heptose:LPS heptosyltransferase